MNPGRILEASQEASREKYWKKLSTDFQKKKLRKFVINFAEISEEIAEFPKRIPEEMPAAILGGIPEEILEERLE